MNPRSAILMVLVMTGCSGTSTLHAQIDGREYESAGSRPAADAILSRFPQGARHEFVMLPLRDGIRLATDIFLPSQGGGPWPAVLIRSPYGRLGLTANASDVARQGGLAYVLQDLRGSGQSEGRGTFAPETSENEINDSYDTVEWIARQPWCNQRVGMIGSSGNGLATVMAYLAKPPHLVVVKPGNTAGNTALYWAFENGVRRWLYGWLSFRGAKPTPDGPKPTLLTYDRHRWDQTLTAAARDNPIVFIGDDGWFNIFQDAGLDFFQRFGPTGKVFMDVRARNHAKMTCMVFPQALSPGPPAPDFFEVLKGSPVTTPSRLTYYVMGDARMTNGAGNIIRTTPVWPPPASPLALYLRADGTLSDQPSPEREALREYPYDPRNPAPSLGGGFSYGTTETLRSEPLDQRPLRDRPDVLRFVSPVLTAPLEIAGKLKADLRISSSARDTLFIVKLVDIYPDGYEAILREGAFMARYRDGYENPTPLEPDAVVTLKFPFNSTAAVFNPGHRIGVYLTSSSTPAYEVHPNTYEPVLSYDRSPIARQRVFMSSGNPSSIILPVTGGVYSPSPSHPTHTATLP